MKWVVIAALAATLFWLYSIDLWHHGYKRQPAARTQIANFLTALGAYYADVAHFPTTEQGLQALRENPGEPRWNGPYLPKDVPRDPWGMSYLYTYPGAHGDAPDIISYGADRQPGGEGISADVVSWR